MSPGFLLTGEMVIVPISIHIAFSETRYEASDSSPFSPICLTDHFCWSPAEGKWREEAKRMIKSRNNFYVVSLNSRFIPVLLLWLRLKKKRWGGGKRCRGGGGGGKWITWLYFHHFWWLRWNVLFDQGHQNKLEMKNGWVKCNMASDTLQFQPRKRPEIFHSVQLNIHARRQQKHKKKKKGKREENI